MTPWRAISLRNFISDDPFTLTMRAGKHCEFSPCETTFMHHLRLAVNSFQNIQGSCHGLHGLPVGGQLVSLTFSGTFFGFTCLETYSKMTHAGTRSSSHKGQNSPFLPVPMVNVKGYSETEFLRLKSVDEGLFMLSEVFLTCSNQDTNKW